MYRACLLAFAFLYAGSGAAITGTLELESCTLHGSSGIAIVEARCGWLDRRRRLLDKLASVFFLNFNFGFGVAFEIIIDSIGHFQQFFDR